VKNAEPLIRFERVTKRYGATTALSEVDFACYPGEIHAILGENGAGKSTLMKMLSGVIQPTEGQLCIEGRPALLKSPRDAIERGLICMFQELSLVPDLNVRENLLLGGKGSGYGFSTNTDLRLARALLDQIDGKNIAFTTRVGELTLAERQQIEIAKALSRKPRLLILDEATSALNATVVEHVFRLIREQRDNGVAVLFISHRFHEIEAIADKISVFRNGEHIDTFQNGQYDYPAIINKMVGQANVMKARFGLLKNTTGKASINSLSALPDSPKAAKTAQFGLAWVPEDRKSEGLILDQSIADNMTLSAVGHPANPQQAVYDKLISALELKFRSLDQPVSDLSGGNQQKVALIKWLVISPKCLLLSDPTRGIDVKTKTQIYTLLKSLSESGMAVILLSSDYEELIHLCHRVHVFYSGRVVSTLSGDSLSAQNIIAASLNMHEGAIPDHV